MDITKQSEEDTVIIHTNTDTDQFNQEYPKPWNIQLCYAAATTSIPYRHVSR